MFNISVGDNEVLGEERSGDIRAAIGLAHLLINQRFKQFSGLIKDCEEEKTPRGVYSAGDESPQLTTVHQPLI